MFEGKQPVPDAASLSEGEPEPAPPLRKLRWDDLTARLSAARDLRAALHPHARGSEGSFDAVSARRIAAHMTGKHPVYLDASSNLKLAGYTADGMAAASELKDPAAPRGNE